MNYNLFSSDETVEHPCHDLENNMSCLAPDEAVFEVSNKTYGIIYDAVELAKRLKSEKANLKKIVVEFIFFDVFSHNDIHNNESGDMEKVEEPQLVVDIDNQEFRFQCTWGDCNDILYTRSFKDLADFYMPF